MKEECLYPHNGLHSSFVKAFGLFISRLNLRVCVCAVWCVCWWDSTSLEKGFVVATLWTEDCLMLGCFLKKTVFRLLNHSKLTSCMWKYGNDLKILSTGIIIVSLVSFRTADPGSGKDFCHCRGRRTGQIEVQCACACVVLVERKLPTH